MEPSEHERTYLSVDGPVRFRDRPRGEQLGASLLAGVLVLAALAAFGVGFRFLAFVSLVGGLACAFGLSMCGCRVVLTDRSLHVQYGLRTQHIPRGAIEQVSVILGRRAGARPGRESVRVRWREGPRTKTTTIETGRAAELVALLGPARPLAQGGG